jgi:GMP synthase (glutamine-hydrolysing)
VKPLLLIRHEAFDTMGLAPACFEQGGLRLHVVNAWEPHADWPDLQEVAGLVVFGGSMNANRIDRYPFLERDRTYLRRAMGDEAPPVLGICLGAQLMASAMDVPVVKSPVKEVGFARLLPTEAGRDDPLLSAFETGDMVFHWHEDMVAQPSGSVLLAAGDDVPVQAFRVGRRAWGVQFHPEVTAEELEIWFDEAGDAMEPEWGKSAQDVRKEMALYLDAQHARARALFTRFAAEVRRAA